MTEPSRRVLLRAAAWTAPSAAVAMSAPAYAASSCIPAMHSLQWTGLTSGASRSAADSEVLVTARTTAGSWFPSNNFTVENLVHSATGEAADYLRLTSPAPNRRSSSPIPSDRTLQTLTVSFRDADGNPAPVTGLSLTIYDLDYYIYPTNSPNTAYQDQVFIPQGAPMPTASRGSQVVGTGTSSNPFRTDAIGAPNEPGGPNQNRQADFSVTLTWPGEVTEISLSYRQRWPGESVIGTENLPTIWLSPMTYTSC